VRPSGDASGVCAPRRGGGSGRLRTPGAGQAIRGAAGGLPRPVAGGAFRGHWPGHRSHGRARPGSAPALRARGAPGDPDPWRRLGRLSTDPHRGERVVRWGGGGRRRCPRGGPALGSGRDLHHRDRTPLPSLGDGTSRSHVLDAWRRPVSPSCRHPRGICLVGVPARPRPSWMDERDRSRCRIGPLPRPRGAIRVGKAR